MVPLLGIASGSRPRLPPPGGPVVAGEGLYAALGLLFFVVVVVAPPLERHIICTFSFQFYQTEESSLSAF